MKAILKNVAAFKPKEQGHEEAAKIKQKELIAKCAKQFLINH
jgi:hypothetical protein